MRVKGTNRTGLSRNTESKKVLNYEKLRINLVDHWENRYVASFRQVEPLGVTVMTMVYV